MKSQGISLPPKKKQTPCELEEIYICAIFPQFHKKDPFGFEALIASGIDIWYTCIAISIWGPQGFSKTCVSKKFCLPSQPTSHDSSKTSPSLSLGTPKPKMNGWNIILMEVWFKSCSFLNLLMCRVPAVHHLPGCNGRSRRKKKIIRLKLNPLVHDGNSEFFSQYSWSEKLDVKGNSGKIYNTIPTGSHGTMVYLPSWRGVDFYGKCRSIYQSHGSYGIEL